MYTLSMWFQHWPITYCQYVEMLPITLRVATQTVINSTDANEVCNIINSLKLSTSKGIDGISSEIVNPVASCIAMYLTSIFNKSLDLGKFSDKLKIAQICSIYKSDDKLQINNYRPISILPVFSKIF